MQSRQHTQQRRNKRITLKTLVTYAQVLGKDSIAYRALRQVRALERDGIRSELFMASTGFLVRTVCHTYRFT